MPHHLHRWWAYSRGRKVLHEPLEALFFGLADRAGSGRFLPGAEIAAHLAPPDRVRQSLTHRCGVFLLRFASLLRRQATFGNRRDGPFPIVNRIGHIERAVAGPVGLQIGVPVIAGTDDIQIVCLAPGGKPARAGPVAVALLIGKQPLDQFLGKGCIGRETVAGGLRLLLELLVGLFNGFVFDHVSVSLIFASS